MRLKEQYKLPDQDVEVLLTIEGDREIPFDGGGLMDPAGAGAGAVAYFDQVCTQGRDPKIVANWYCACCSTSPKSKSFTLG